MTVYVHKMEGQPGRFWVNFAGGNAARQYGKTETWFLLTADSEDELHTFAASLGLTRTMFRPAEESLPRKKPQAARYLITAGERDRASGLGARLITGREAARLLQQRSTGMPFA